MSKDEREWIELVGVTAQVFPMHHVLTQEDIELIGDRGHWYCSEGNDLEDENVVLDGRLQADLTVFEFSFVASRSYARRMWHEFNYIEHEHVNYGTVMDDVVLEGLATIAKGLLAQCEGCSDTAVRFLAAWGVTLHRGGHYGEEYWNEAILRGWANITLEGMKIIPVEECAKMEPPVRVSRPAKLPVEDPPF